MKRTHMESNNQTYFTNYSDEEKEVMSIWIQNLDLRATVVQGT